MSLIFKNKRGKKPKHKIDFKIKIGIYMVFIVLFAIFWTLINKEVMPVIRSMARNEAKMIAVKLINGGVNKTIRASEVTTQDLLFYDYNEAGEIVSWNINSIRINELCADVAEVIVKDLNEIGTIQLKIPLGILAGVHMFSNVGPSVTINVLPKGTASIDYKNQLRATGINQVNHTVWLEIELKMQIIVPLSSEEMIVRRNVVLVDKVISGKVPTHYLNLPIKE